MNNTTDWAAIAQKLHQDCRALESKLAEVTKQRDYAHQKCSEYRIVALGAEDKLENMTAQRDAFRDELSKVMPPDYKDWWQNDKNEWPIVARLTIESKKRLIDMDRETIERLERKLAEVTKHRDVLMETLKIAMARAYARGYQHGHGDSVESSFINVKEQDAPEYFAEDVTQMLLDGGQPEAAAALAAVKGGSH